MFEDRLIVARTPVPAADPARALRFSRMTGAEQISACYRYHLRLVSEDLEVKGDSLLGRGVTVEVSGRQDDPRGPRFFNGLVDTFSFAGIEQGMAAYDLELVPNFHFLSKTTDNRIFQEKSVVDIIRSIFDEHGFANYELRLTGTYAPRQYCVQYGETDLDFVQRLMEHEGIFYFFEHGDAEHRMILADRTGALKPVSGWQSLPFEPDASVSLIGLDAITQLSRTDMAVTGAYAHTDYDFTKPSSDLMAPARNDRLHPEGMLERYHYPGTFTEHARGDRLARVRNEQDQAMAERVFVTANARGPMVGSVLEITDYPREIENRSYFVQRAAFDLFDGQYMSEDRKEIGEGYEVRLALIPVSVPCRPAPLTPKPVMKGPQTAIVVGPAGEEIHTDEYARVRVQFHWDREGKWNENSTCFIRVSSAWAGAGWGFIQIPRIGQEVIVDFLEGDPDQPIITGRVYNAEQMPPYDLPGNATQSGWKSDSSKGGGGSNELRFEDAKGTEQVYFHAEKDRDDVVEHNETRQVGNDFAENVDHDAQQSIGHDRTETVANNKSTSVGVDRDVSIGSNDTETVGANRSLSVGVDETIKVGSSSTETIGTSHTQTVGAAQTLTVGAARVRAVAAAETVNVGGAQAVTVGAGRSVTVGSSQSRTIGSSETVTVGADQSTTIGGAHSVEIGKTHSVTVAEDQVFKIDADHAIMATGSIAHTADKDIVLEAKSQIVLKCGSASITMKKNGDITISGKDITLKGSGKIGAKAGGDMTLKASKINQN